MSSSRNIPSLDGLRAIAVLMVLIAHESTSAFDFLPASIVRNGALGVDMFFVISGFLITHLILAEIDKYGRLDLRAFYVRRAWRIFPAFYVYLLAVAVAVALHIFQMPLSFLLSAATYTSNYFPRTPQSWVVAHSWSLCVEEHFYLLWPACLAFRSRRFCLRVASTLILLSPFIRTATYYIDRQSLGSISFMSHTRADALMVGCFISLAINMSLFPKLLHLAKQPLTAVAAVLILTMVEPRLPNWYGMSFGLTVDAICCGVILLFAVSKKDSVAGRILNNRWLKHIGLISYSLYLWQQMFEGPNTRYACWNFLAVFACAEASFWLVERPALRLRDRLTRKNPVDRADDKEFMREIEAA